jgi:multicomponent Na+:H+ antiporter subunit G
METVLQILGCIFVSIGAIFLLLGAIGIIRMPDIYSRLQAGTKASTMGSIGMLLGVGFLEPSWIFKILIIIFFVMISNPISSHAIARGSCRSGVHPKLFGAINMYEEVSEECKESNKKDKK